ncbi:hypothetical protein EYF80_017075 [Liparis tanakae]|uniref:Uncharacterized protein n=1 Tax=Liparis tanakae TaxID=230148 RepID=A0A4Z2I3H6_9TELE|nr:hypothetical protein EYF80_017075 [Liparis tanakae]
MAFLEMFGARRRRLAPVISAPSLRLLLLRILRNNNNNNDDNNNSGLFSNSLHYLPLQPSSTVNEAHSCYGS